MKLHLTKRKYKEKTLEKNIHLYTYGDWINISWNQTLSEEFINKYIDYMDWAGIWTTQNLSKEFIISNLNKLPSMDLLKLNPNISKRTLSIVKSEFEQLKTLKEII